MPARPRDNRTPDGAKRRWTADDRAARTSRPSRATGDAPRGDSRAARREARFGGQEERTGGKRGIDWYPGPRNGSRDDRPRRDDRDDRRPSRDGRPSRDDRSERPHRDGASEPRRFDRSRQDDRGSRPARDDRPRYSDRPARDDRPRYQDRPARDDRPRYQDRPRRDDRPRYEDRPARDDRPRYSDRPVREDRPRRDDRPRYEDRPARDDRPRRDDRPARDDRPRYEDRPRRDDRPRYQNRPARDDRRGSGRDGAPQRRFEERRPVREQQTPRPWEQEDVVLERLDAEVVTPDDVAGSSFTDLGLGRQITAALAELGATEPFPIQAATIPPALEGRNVLGRGRTGSGKTIAFGAALVERLMRNWADSGRTGTGRRMGRPPRALVLAPTRELAYQIDRTVQPIARAVGLFTTQIVGGVPQGRQVGALAKGVDIVIGTPGRIEDLLAQGRLDLSEVEITVLDEADHMAELGFIEPMQRLLRTVPAGGQRLLFSATLDAAVSELVDEFLPNPAVHEVADPEGGSTADHRVLVIDQGQKLPVLTALVAAADRSLVFARTRAFAEQLADDLDAEGVKAESLHGDLNQARRSRNLAKFSEGRVAALVATDVAARGIHVDDVELVVHADSAEDYKTYLHRSGRTGRAGASGTVVTLITARRRRRFTELLERAGVEAEFVVLHEGDDPVAAIGR